MKNLFEAFQENKDVSMKPNKEGTLYSVKYRDLGVDWSNPLTRMARGIIIDKEGEIIARPFEKFFNLNELEKFKDYSEDVVALSQADQGPIEVSDKLDGSLAIAFWYEGEMRFASSGSLKSDYIVEFKEALYKQVGEENYKKIELLSQAYTLIFEYTSPKNTIVVQYNETRMSLIGMIATRQGMDMPMSWIKKVTSGLNLYYPESFEFESIDEVLVYLEGKENIEGVVVRFLETGKRVKIKTEDYLKSHKSLKLFDKSNEDKAKNLQVVIKFALEGQDGDIDDLLSSSMFRYAPQEFFDEINAMRSFVAKEISKIEHFKENVKDYESDLLELDIPYGKTQVDLVMMSVADIDYTHAFIKDFRHQLISFRKKQECVRALRDTYAKFSEKRSLDAAMKDIYKTAFNYNQLISAKSFAFKEYDVSEYLLYNVDNFVENGYYKKEH